MSEEKIFKTFIKDSITFLENLSHIQNELLKTPRDTELILQAFRNVHSLKSEAAFLNEEEIVVIAHSLETLLERYKRPGSMIIKPDIEKMNLAIERMHEIIDYYNNTSDESGMKANGSKSSLDSAVSEKQVDVSRFPSMTEFEKSLLEEAKSRGEKFYRLVFAVDSDCPMKYAKAFLVISNLESIVNVIRTVPAFGKEDEELYKKMSIYFTSSISDSEIYKAVNVDQVEDIRLIQLSYDVYIKDTPFEKMRKRKTDSIKVDLEKIDKISNYLDEIKIDIHRILKILPKIDKQNLLQNYVKRIREYSIDLEEVVKQIEMVSLADSFRYLKRYVSDLAVKLGKRAELTITGSDIKVSRKSGDLIYEIVLHLLRNAIDHGIEKEETRINGGKSPEGHIEIKVEKLDDTLKVSVQDDGRGIDREMISSKLTNGEIDLAKDDNLLKILTKTGNTSREGSNFISGRGMGLNIVAHKISQLQGGELLLDSTINEGTKFTIILPGGITLTSFQLFRVKDRIIAVPSRNIIKIVDITPDSFEKEENGILSIEGIYVYSLDGKILASDKNPAASKGVYIKYLDKKGILLTDEVLFEKSLSEQNLTLVIEDNEFLYKVLYGDLEADYFYLNPAIITV